MNMEDNDNTSNDVSNVGAYNLLACFIYLCRRRRTARRCRAGNYYSALFCSFLWSLLLAKHIQPRFKFLVTFDKANIWSSCCWKKTTRNWVSGLQQTGKTAKNSLQIKVGVKTQGIGPFLMKCHSKNYYIMYVSQLQSSLE